MKKLFMMLLVMVVSIQLLNAGVVFGAESTVDTSIYVPKLSVDGNIDIPEATAGWMTTLNLPIKNISDNNAWNVQVSLEIDDKAKYPAIFDKLRLTQTVKSIHNEETVNVAYEFKVSSAIPEGIYPLKISYQFENAYNDAFTSSETIYIRIKNDNSIPRLIIDSVVLNPDIISPGSDVEMKINIKNIGSFAAKDIKFTLQGLKNEEFSIKDSTDVRYAHSIDEMKTIQFTYILVASDAIAKGNHELAINMQFRDSASNTYTEDTKIFIPVLMEGAGKPNLLIDKIQAPKGNVTANKDFTVSFDLNNTGLGTAKNIKVSLTSDKELVSKSLSTINIDKIDKSVAKKVEFTLYATQEAVTKNYPIAINIEYEDTAGVKHTASQYVGVYIENGSGKSVPRIIISKYELEPVYIKAGQDFKLKLSFLNTSSMTGISNIKASFTSDDGVLTPTSSNTFFIETVDTKKTVEKELTLHVKPDAEAKSYILSVNFEYEDDKGNPFTSKETISVPVTQNPRFITGELSLPPETIAGQPLQVYVDFYNMGKATLYNLMVKAEGDFQGQNLSYYVGNFESGRTDSFDASITPNAPGALTGNIVFSFEDANGQKSEIKKEFTVNVTEMNKEMMMPAGGDKGAIAMGPDGKPITQVQAGPRISFILWGIVAFVIIGGIVTFITLRKRHNKRKEMSLDE